MKKYKRLFKEAKINDKQLNILLKNYKDDLGSLFKTYNDKDIKQGIIKVVNSKGNWDNYIMSNEKGINLDQIDFVRIKKIIPEFLLK